MPKPQSPASRIPFAARLRGVGIVLALCLGMAPLAMVVTITLLPLGSFIERRFATETLGHSGPAEWCCLASTCSCSSARPWSGRLSSVVPGAEASTHGS